jgi:alkylation response protein AidB-like acyl-CoA dehydrogenase
MQAQPSEDGSHFILNGEKRYITNASIAQVFDCHGADTLPGKEGKTAITAFLVTPDMPGFEMVEARMPKLGIRGRPRAVFDLTTCGCREKIFWAP